MKENSSTKTGKDIITPEIKSGIPLNAVKFKKSWTFWETYVSKTEDLSFENSNKLILEENKEYLFITDRNGAFTDKIKEINYDNELINFYSFPYTINPKIDVWGIGIL